MTRAVSLQYVSVQVKGVPTSDIIDTNADIKVARLKKRNLKDQIMYLELMTERSSSYMAEWTWKSLVRYYAHGCL